MHKCKACSVAIEKRLSNLNRCTIRLDSIGELAKDIKAVQHELSTLSHKLIELNNCLPLQEQLPIPDSMSPVKG